MQFETFLGMYDFYPCDKCFEISKFIGIYLNEKRKSQENKGKNV